MNILNKLAQLLKDSPYIDMHDNYIDYGLAAKYLIEHGVTIQGRVPQRRHDEEWVPVTQRRPDKELDVVKAVGGHAYACLIVIRDTDRLYVEEGFYERADAASMWCWQWRFLDKDHIDVSDKVTHWAPKPAMPEILHGGGGGA